MTPPEVLDDAERPAVLVPAIYITLRDYFASAALTGIFAGGGLAALLDNAKGKDHNPLVAFAAYELADAMLAEREKKP